MPLSTEPTPSIHPFHGLALTLVEETLLRELYRDKEELHILQQFGGGLSGSRVLKVQAFGADGTQYLTQVVKIGPRDEIRAERVRYDKYFKDRLPNAAPVANHAEQGFQAAVIYEDATANQNLKDVMSLGDYFDRHHSDEVHAALGSIFGANPRRGSGLRYVYRHYQVNPRTYRQLFGTILPENLVVGLDPRADCDGVYQQGQGPQIRPDVLTLSPSDIEPSSASLRQLKPGDAVVLAKFLTSKIQADDLNLEDGKHEWYRVKVLYQGTVVDGVAKDNYVDVVGHMITDRQRRMRFAIDDCLRRHGLKRHPKGFHLDNEIYPEPLQLLDEVLDKRCEVAWGTIHGDLHWDNVMLQSASNWQLIDYGMTRKGAIVFDFVKLELYLRRTQLTKIANLTPAQVLAFEQDLVDNPVGRLPNKDHEHSALNKAAAAIRTIRRLARRYLVEDFFDYWRFLFVYAIALSKYYPTKDKWEEISEATSEPKAFDESARLCFFALAPALVVGRVLAWERSYPDRPSLNYEFRPIASQLTPQTGAVMLDVGGSVQSGIIDHHCTDQDTDERECTASLVFKNPELVTEHLANTDPNTVRWIVPESPNFDCAVSVYLAWHRANLGFFPPGAAELQRYTVAEAAGAGFLETVQFPDRTPYALAVLHGNEWDQTDAQAVIDTTFMDNALEVMDYLCQLEVTGIHALDSNRVPHEHGFWNVTMDRDKKIYQTYDKRDARKFAVDLWLDGHNRSLRGLAMTSPRSLFFKAWARRGDYPVLAVSWPHSRDESCRRIIVSVPSSYQFGLKGLGKALEAAESKKREQLGKPRPNDNPRWPDVDNNDPWYDGRMPVHNYNIVDSPREGTVLELDEVVAVLVRSNRWMVRSKNPSGKPWLSQLLGWGRIFSGKPYLR